MSPRPRSRAIAIAVALLLGVLAIAAGGFAAWALTPLGPAEDALDALESDDVILVEQSEAGYEFRARDESPTVGLVLYPGGRVDVRSYAPLARETAMHGYLVVLVPMRLNLAVLSPDRADAVIERHPEIVMWAVGGHSLGGAMAARYAAANPHATDALVLLAAYPPESTDLSGSDIAVTSVYGSFDGLLDAETFNAATKRLPPDTVYVDLQGGNHAQFGSYGPQRGDNPAAMPPDDQLWHTVNAIAEMLRPLRIRSGG